MSEGTGVPVWIDGQPASQVPVTDRGLAYGDGLFETFRITTQGPVLADYHLARLQVGAERLQLSLSPVQLKMSLRAYPGFQVPGIVKMMVTRGCGGRGYSPAGAGVPRLVLQHFPLPVYPDEWYEQGIQVFSCRTRLGHNPLLAGIKHLNRLEQVMARAEWGQADEFQEGLVCDIEGRPVEGVMSNLFTVQDGQLSTPLLDRCGVAGVMRRWLMEQFQAQGFVVTETAITLNGFRVADERFFCNSVFGVWPVARFEGLHWSPGPVSRMAQQLIHSHWF